MGRGKGTPSSVVEQGCMHAHENTHVKKESSLTLTDKVLENTENTGKGLRRSEVGESGVLSREGKRDRYETR